MSPARRREAVDHLETAFDVSERRACRVMNQPRSTHRYSCAKPSQDAPLARAIRDLAAREPRAGYRAVTRLLRRDGWPVNRKRVHRIWKREGLKVPAKPASKRARGDTANSTQKRRAQALNQVWSYDFVHDQTTDGRSSNGFPSSTNTARSCWASKWRGP